MSDIEGALAAVVPVAAHMPGGGFASINFPVAVRILVETDDALVEVRARVVVDVGSAAGLDAAGLRMPSGCGNGTGVCILLLEAMSAKGCRLSVVCYAQLVAPSAACAAQCAA